VVHADSPVEAIAASATTKQSDVCVYQRPSCQGIGFDPPTQEIVMTRTCIYCWFCDSGGNMK
jgi:hypothetical protein